MKYQVIQRNDYGNTTIVGSSDDLQGAVKIAKKFVSEDNMENALTMADKMMDFESYYIEVLGDNGDITDEAVYGGRERGKDFLYCFEGGEVRKVFLDGISVPMKFYIGTDNKKPIFAGNPSRKQPGKFDEISDINDKGLQNRMVYYINVIK